MFKIKVNGYNPRWSVIMVLTTVKKVVYNPYIPRCRDCCFACEYVPVWSYPFSNPKCSVHHVLVAAGDVACCFFKPVGRLSE